MTLTPLARTVAAAAAASLALAGLLPAASATEATSPRDRTITIERVSQENVDVGELGSSVGDLRATQGIARTASGKRIGTYATSQVTVATGLAGGVEQRSVIMEITLRGGEISIVGIYEAPAGAPPVRAITHVIVGGTGDFFGARGTMTMTPASATTYTVKLDFA